MYLKDILHLISQNLLVPVMIVLFILVIYSIFSVGSLLVEMLVERRHFKVVVPDFVNAINEAAPERVADVVKASGLLKDQKKVLLTVAANMSLPAEDLFALAKAELTHEDEMYRKVVGRNETAAKIGPMCGLLGTLIPLGPGIVAMGQGDVATLSSSLLVAFDTTIAGLASAVIGLLISRCRKRWYARYMMALETGVRCILQKADSVTKIEGPTSLDSGSSVFLEHNAVIKAELIAMGADVKLPQNLQNAVASEPAEQHVHRNAVSIDVASQEA